jgi:hypothetical protein
LNIVFLNCFKQGLEPIGIFGFGFDFCYSINFLRVTGLGFGFSKKQGF